MTEQEKLATSEEVGRPGLSPAGMLGLGTLVVTSVCLVVLLASFAASAALNVYLGWQMSGLNVSLATRTPQQSTAAAVAAPTQVIVVVPAANAPNPAPAEAGAPLPSATKTPGPGPSMTNTPVVVNIQTVAPVVVELTTTPAPTSTNTYVLIPLEGRREQSRPDAENADLNLKLRELQLNKAALSLVDVSGSPQDPDAPKFSAVFEPNFVATYAVHDWDWGCNCKGGLIENEHSVLVGVSVTPGQPIYIPHRKQDIYQGKYYAVVLYASKDSLTFMYHRGGTVASGYTIHYQGLQTDPNLLALYQGSKGTEAPGLTLDTPVGVAAGDELIVAIRDNGAFLDARSRKDWWE